MSTPLQSGLAGYDETPDVWATTASASGDSPAATTAPAAGDSPDARSVLHAVANPLPPQLPPIAQDPFLWADLDPFAPDPSTTSRSSQQGSSAPFTTLGHSVAPASKLEILPDSDSEPSPSPTADSFTQLPTSFQLDGEHTTAPAPSPHPTSKPTPNLGSRPAPVPASSSFLGGVFRSISGTSSPAPATPTKPPPLPRNLTDEQAIARLRQELGGGGGGATPTPSTPSTGAGAPAAASTPSSTLAKPLASIASVFRSPLSSKSTTPTSGTSPSNTRSGGEKMAEAAARRSEHGQGEKEKPKNKEEEKEALFDFNKFLEQMRSRSADPIAKYLRSFLKEFSRRPPVSTVDQIRVINDFLDFIAGKMRGVDPWRSLWREHDEERAENEFEMAMEAMEKLVMNRVWHLTFTPALDLTTLPGQTSSEGDVERDAILSQRIKLFAWIKPSHLDLPIADPEDGSGEDEVSRPGTPRMVDLLSGDTEDGGSGSEGGGEGKEKGEKSLKSKAGQRQVQGFLDFARRELGKMNQYKAPRDKLICVLNCCKVIFGLIRHLSTKEEGADTFIPFLIYVVLKANPEHLVSNLQYIQRFRNPDKLSGEGGYYLSSLNGAISFIETVDASSLSNITQEEFETNVAQAIRNLPQPDDSPRLTKPPQFPSPSTSPNPGAGRRSPRPPPPPPHGASPSSGPRPDLPVTSPEALGPDVDSPSLLHINNQGAVPTSFPSTATRFLLRSTDSVERIVSKPLGAIGRIFDQLDQAVADVGAGGRPGVPQDGGNGLSPRDAQGGQPLPALPPGGTSVSGKRRSGRGIGGEDLEGMYAREGSTVEEVSREIDRQHEEQRLASIQTLKSVFPGLEDEVLEMVLLSNSGDMAKTIDALLEMS